MWVTKGEDRWRRHEDDRWMAKKGMVILILRKNDSTGGRVALRAWDICEENGVEWACKRDVGGRERRWAA